MDIIRYAAARAETGKAVEAAGSIVALAVPILVGAALAGSAGSENPNPAALENIGAIVPTVAVMVQVKKVQCPTPAVEPAGLGILLDRIEVLDSTAVVETDEFEQTVEAESRCALDREFAVYLPLRQHEQREPCDHYECAARYRERSAQE